jgi:isopentenyldiphosphate isomerase
VDDIIFGGSSHVLVSNFQEMMEEFQMSMMRELTFFLGIQVKQMKQGIFVHQAKYMKDRMKKFNITELKPVSTPMSMTTTLDLDENGDIFLSKRVQKHDCLPPVPHDDTARHLIRVCLCARFQASPRSSHRTTVQ